MKLHLTHFRKFSFRDTKTKEFWSVWAMYVGSPGRRYRQEIIPISFGDNGMNSKYGHNKVDESLPCWEVVPTRSGRPKIVWSGKETSGIICRLSSNNGFGRAIGDVLVNRFDLENIIVLAHGVGGIDATGELWNEYIVTIDFGARFLIQTTKSPDVISEWEEATEVKNYMPNEKDYQDHVSLSDPQVKRWIRSERIRNGK